MNTKISTEIPLGEMICPFCQYDHRLMSILMEDFDMTTTNELPQSTKLVRDGRLEGHSQRTSRNGRMVRNKQLSVRRRGQDRSSGV